MNAYTNKYTLWDSYAILLLIFIRLIHLSEGIIVACILELSDPGLTQDRRPPLLVKYTRKPQLRLDSGLRL